MIDMGGLGLIGLGSIRTRVIRIARVRIAVESDSGVISA